MAQHKSRAFILDSRDYRETSRLLHVLCENEGRISLVARGMRSPKSKMSAAADPFSILQITYTLKEGSTMGTISSLESERLFQCVRNDLGAYALAGYWFEALQRGSEARVSAEGLFRLTEDFLFLLERRSSFSREHQQAFLGLLQELGFGIQLDACLLCGTHRDVSHFDALTGGAVCARCADPNRKYLPIVASLQDGDQRELSESEIAATLQIVNEMLTIGLEHRFKTADFLAQMLTPHYARK